MSSIREHRRLAILQLLSKGDSYGHQQHLIIAELERVGVPGTESETLADMSWLQAAGLVNIEAREGGNYYVMHLTTLGEEVCNRKRFVQGIAKPRLQAPS